MPESAGDRNAKPSRIPEFASLKEEAEFWDTHDFTDYLDELRSARIHRTPIRDQNDDPPARENSGQ